MDTTRGTLLGGRVAHEQPREGHRTGIEPVLLAAFVPARPGQSVLEGGTGSGAGLLCLMARVPGLRGAGVERDPAMADLARRNVAANPLAEGATIVEADLLTWRADPPVDHAFANPPWHRADGSPSPVPAKEAAKRGGPGLIAAWIAALARTLKDRGTLSLVVPARSAPESLDALARNGCGSACLLPLWPRARAEARLVLVRAVKGGRGPFRLLGGLVLHRDGGSLYTPEADAVFRSAAALAPPLPLRER